MNNNNNTGAIKNKQSKSKRWRYLPYVICSLSSLFYVYDFFVRVAPSAITHELMRDFHMDAKALGIMSAFFFYAYTPMQIPAGLLYDRFGPRILMTLMMALCSLGAVIFGSTHSVEMLSLARFMIGFASAFAFVGSLILAARWFPPKYFALITGLVQVMGCLGAIVGEAPVALVTPLIGWRNTFLYTAAIGAVITVLFWLILRDGPTEETISHVVHVPAKNEFTRLWTVCKNPQTWWAGLCGFACWAPITAFAELWGVPFLQAKYHVSSAIAAGSVSVVWIGIAVGSPVIGWWSDAIRSRRIPLVICNLIGFIAALSVIYLPTPNWWIMYVFLFMYGVAASAQAITFGVVQDNNPPSVAGTALGFNNMAVIFGGLVVQPVIGILLKSSWTGEMLHGAPVYSAANYLTAFSIIPLCSVLGIIVSIFFLKETHCEASYGQ